MKILALAALAGLMSVTALSPALADDDVRTLHPFIQFVDDNDD